MFCTSGYQIMASDRGKLLSTRKTFGLAVFIGIRYSRSQMSSTDLLTSILEF